MNQSWIGVDFDGTLAYYDPNSYTPGVVGEPVPAMLERVRSWLREGKTVKIFTARATNAVDVKAIKAWLQKQQLPDLEVTDRKDHNMEVCYDDKAVQVILNTGRLAVPEKEPQNAWESFNSIFSSTG